MAHIRKSIRDTLVTTLTGLTTTGARVYPSRVYPFADAALPGLAIYTQAEAVEYLSMTRPRTQGRALSARVEVYVKGVGDYDDSIDTICAEIEAALYADITLGGLVKDVQVKAFEVEFSGEGDQPMARATLTINIDYRTTEGAPGAAV